MKLYDACDIGKACGLETVGEAVLNISMHAISIFAYDQLNDELNELYSEADAYDDATPIATILAKQGKPNKWLEGGESDGSPPYERRLNANSY